MIKACRLCGGAVGEVLNLGNMAFTGIFPHPGEDVPRGKLTLVMCDGPCGLVQLADQFDLALMYGTGYGYRSGLNEVMASHLHDIANNLVKLVDVREDDICIDIGSNDGTFLEFLPDSTQRIGIDPSGIKFFDHYPNGAALITDFFPSKELEPLLVGRKAKLITSIAMFYDLENPLDFATNVKSLLTPEGVWYMEQSYLPAMLAQNAYDTICHEHIEYYSLRQISYIARQIGLKIIKLGFTDTNGGSFELVLAHKESGYPEAPNLAAALLNELNFELDKLKTYIAFEERIKRNRDRLNSLLDTLPTKPWGFGASTKGNVLLQYCGIGPNQLEAIYDINPDKAGRVTPGTNIPIVGECPKDATFLALPWHFGQSLVDKHPEHTFIFPLPDVQVHHG